LATYKKHGEERGTNKSYRQFSLTAFLLESMEKLNDLNIRLKYLKWLTTAPQEVVLLAFIDVKGSFEKIQGIISAAEMRQIDSGTVDG
jgi:hypothetical protein